MNKQLKYVKIQYCQTWRKASKETPLNQYNYIDYTAVWKLQEQFLNGDKKYQRIITELKGDLVDKYKSLATSMLEELKLSKIEAGKQYELQNNLVIC